MNGSKWTPGNRFRLLENGEEFFPRVFEAIASAEREVLLETFILFEDEVGKQLHAALLAAAGRGAEVNVLVNGYGSPNLSPEFVLGLTSAGVRLRAFDPRPRVFGWRTNVFRRMHRKIVVVNGVRSFVGGLNYAIDQMAGSGPAGKQDYAVEIEGPIVGEIRRFVHGALERGPPKRRWFHRRAVQRLDGAPPATGTADAMFVTRDNDEHTNDIERHYRVAIRAARQRVVIANAYFFPGYRLLHELRKAARRGVDVRLILQGNPDLPIAKAFTGMLYEDLLRAGVRIHEYCQRPLHGKVALTDDEWSTVGSSNLDPLSLFLNLEANVVIRDRAFNGELGVRLDTLLRQCKEVEAAPAGGRSKAWLAVRSFVLFHVLRRFPQWAGWLPAHTPRLAPLHPPASDAARGDAERQPDDLTAQKPTA